MERAKNPVTFKIEMCLFAVMAGLLVTGCTPQHRAAGTGKQARARALASPSPSPTPPPPDAGFTPTPMPGLEVPAKWSLRGVTLLPEAGNPYGSKQACEKVQTAKPLLDLNAVAVRQYVVMNNWDQPDLVENVGVSDKDIQNQIAINSQLGLKSAVILGTTVNVNAPQVSGNACGDGTWVPWHGIVDFDGKGNYDKWFAAYETVLQKYLNIAAGSGQVALFSIGNEMGSLTSTVKLKDSASSGKYVGNLRYFLNSRDPAQHSYAKTVIEHLLDFETVHFKEATELRNWAETGKGAAKDGGLTSDASKRLVGLENDRRAYLLFKWNDLISNLKKSLAGYPQAQRPLLTYNVNFDGYDQTEFWGSLDRLSVSAYFPLADYNASGVPIAQNEVTTDYLKAKLKSAFAGLGQFAEARKTKVIFSELGYTNRLYTTLHPWAFSGCEMVELPGQSSGSLVNDNSEPFNNQERANAITALQQLSDDGDLPWLDGVFLWNLYSGADMTGGDSYTLFASSQPTGNTLYENAIADLFKSVSERMPPYVTAEQNQAQAQAQASGQAANAHQGHGKAAAQPNQSTSANAAAVPSPGPSICN